MSGLAQILLDRGVTVTGSDLVSNEQTTSLRQQGIHIAFRHSPENIPKNATVVFTSMIDPENPELQEAKKRGNPIWHRSDLLHCLMQNSEALAVTGTHGKTTTTALLAATLKEAGCDPTWINGGVIKQYGTNAMSGQGRFIVVEADESDGTFTKYTPTGAIVTNIDKDHMDHFQTEERLLDSFSTFLGNVTQPELLFYCGDDPQLFALRPPGVSYGFGQCMLKGINYRQNGWKSVFDIVFDSREFQDVEVSLIGKHNALNALGVFGLALRLGISESDIRKAFRTFQGVKRRCDHLTSVSPGLDEAYGVSVIDDYAHHPTEIHTTLHAIRDAILEKRLIAIFQPHRYSRTELCLHEFPYAFDEADLVIVTDIYAAGEKPIPGVNAKAVAEQIEKYHHSCLYMPQEHIVGMLCSLVRPHDVIVTIGAGNIDQTGSEFVEQLRKTPPQKWRVGIVTGGRSLEHEVAYLSAHNIFHSMNRQFYQVQLFGIGKDGVWHLGNGLDELQSKTAHVSALEKSDILCPEVLRALESCDVVFPVLHGPYGEDGTIQGFFEMLDKAYVGPDHRSAAIAMDKARTKRLASQNEVPTMPYVHFTKDEWRKNQEKILQQILSKIDFPLFVKGIHLGSSIGVNKVEKREDLIPAIHNSFTVDTEIIVELGIQGREIEFCLLGNDYIRVFPPGEILTQGKVYDYKGKYDLINGTPTTPKADLPADVAAEGMKFAEMAYRATGCQGMARIDFFLDKQNHWWFNEINPIPGFTSNSLYPKGCEVNGLPQPKLIDTLIILGLQRQRKNRVLTRISPPISNEDGLKDSSHATKFCEKFGVGMHTLQSEKTNV